MNPNLNNDEVVNWSVFSCSQNLPAILNDPKRGKQKDFFTKTWGEAFIESTVIPPSPHLEDIPNAYFATYYKKLLKRNKKYRDRQTSISGPGPSSASGNQRQDSSSNNLFPQFTVKDHSQLLKSEASPIPKIYFSQTFTLSNSETFREVFAVDGSCLPSKFVQDKLSHYLDLVEVGLAQQISKKSSAFFSAVSTQDKVAEKVTRAILVVKQIKDDLVEIKEDNVNTPLQIVQLQRRKTNYVNLYQKLQLMSTVHQAQRAIQSLLGNSDFVGALDLISTTQDVLLQELQGLVSFRHLDSQLVEIRNAIEKMLRAEMERNLSADLNRPVDQVNTFLDKDRLVSIIFGHFRLGKVAAIITVLAKEISTAMTTTCKQTLIEAISESDSKSDSLINSSSIFQGIAQLPTELWVKMVTSLGDRLVLLMEHIKDVILLFQNCADIAVGRPIENEGSAVSAAYMSESEEPLITEELYNNFSGELSTQLNKTTENADEKFTGMLRFRKTWVIRNEVLTTLQVVKTFTAQLESFANSLHSETETPKSFRFKSVLEMKVQVTEFMRNFHLKQIENVNTALDREKWRVVNEEKVKKLWPTLKIKLMLEKKYQLHLAENLALSNGQTNNNNSTTLLVENCEHDDKKTKSVINNGCDDNNEIILTAELFYILLDAVAEYCHLLILTGSAEVVVNVVDLLRVTNTRIAHLVLGAGAVELKMCKSITVTILVVVLRGLTLVAESVSEIKDIFDKHLNSAKSRHVLKQINVVYQEYCKHADSVESKMVSILEDVIKAELQAWEARPPVPSAPINNVSKNILKFREAIGNILDENKLSALFIKVDKIFRTKLKERIAALGILKDGGPRHGVVTSEMMQYADNLRKLNVLPDSIISNSRLTNDLWS